MALIAERTINLVLLTIKKSPEKANKMTHTFEIKVQCKGQAVGTLNWLNSVLEDGELVISNTKSGEPGMFLKSKTKSETQKSRFICKVTTTDDENQAYYQTKKLDNDTLLMYVYPQFDNFGDRPGFTNFALTPSAYEKCEEFIESAIDTYMAWWKEQ